MADIKVFSGGKEKQIRGLSVEKGSGGGDGMEPRVAKLESDVAHILREVGDIKTDVRELRKKTDEIKDAISSAKVWALLLYVGLAAALLGAMAKGFKWL